MIVAALFVIVAVGAFLAGIVAVRVSCTGPGVLGKVSEVTPGGRNEAIQPYARAARSVAMAAEVSRKAFGVAKNVFAFMWRWKWALMAVLLFFWLAAVLKSCVSFGDFGKSRGEIARERDILRGTLAKERELGRAVAPILGTWERARAGIERDLAIGAEQIDDAAHGPQEFSRENESVSRAVFIAWAHADQRLCGGAGGCGDTGA